MSGGRPPPAPRPLDDAERERLEALLEAVPAPLDPLDTGMLDGFLCGVLVQPQPLPASRWMPHVTDVDGRPVPAGFDAGELRALVARRHAELAHAIAARTWFDPWVYELDDDVDPRPEVAVLPWVAGFAAALELFPGLLHAASPAAQEALALIYRYLGADDLENADELLAVIATLEPPGDLAEAVEDLVRGTLLLADASKSKAPVRRTAARAAARRSGGRP
ncbi:MAG TPA: YecA family protein [Caldimonas sp.]|nr:YecA family protein [Caldimonas sp.]